MGRLNDNEVSALMRASLAGDRVATRDFFRAIVPMLEYMTASMVPAFTAETREDIVQDILTSIHEKRLTWKTELPILPWIYAITRYRIIDNIRRDKRRLPIVDDVDLGKIPERIPVSILDRIDLERGINHLGGQMGSIVRSISLEGKDVRTISREVTMSENAVRIAFHRGIKKLRVFFNAGK